MSAINRRGFIRTATAGIGASLNNRIAAPSRIDLKNPGKIFDVRSYGAKGDGVTLDTLAIQQAIDDCTTNGGGTVMLCAGTFLTQTLRLKSNLTLFIDSGAVLMGTRNVQDYAEITPSYVCYTYSNRSLLFAEKAINLSILGKGSIDLQGRSFPPQVKHTDLSAGILEWGESPFAVQLFECSNLSIRDITIRNCPMAALRIVAANGAVLDGVRIDNRVRISCDGIEIVSSSHVCMSNCRIDSWDDALCIKSASLDLCRNITVTNCTLRSLCNGIKLGTESNGGFENITISNCTLEGGESQGWRSINALALMIVDGGRMNRINISDIVIQGFRTAIFVHIGDRARTFSPSILPQPVGTLTNVSLANIQADVVDEDICCSITGLPGHLVENVCIENTVLRSPGGKPAVPQPRRIPELPKAYPESLMYGPLPASGFYCRHVKGITFHNLTLQLASSDARPAIVFDDAEDVVITGLVAANTGPEPLIRLSEARNVLLQSCRPQAQTFLSVAGKESSNVAMVGNDFRRVVLPVAKAEGFMTDVLEAENLHPGNPRATTPEL